MEEKKQECSACGSSEGEIIEFVDGVRHVRMQDCIRYLAEEFRTKRASKKK